MYKSFLTVIILALGLPLMAAETVRLNDATTPLVNGVRDTTFSLLVDSPSGDGTSDTAPAKVYVPMDTDGTPNDSQSVYAVGTDDILLSTSVGEGSLTFFFDLNKDGQAVFFYAAIKEDSDSYHIIENVTQTPSEGDNIAVSVAMSDLCTADKNGPSTLDCDTNFIEAANPTAQKNVIVYFFYDTNNALVGENDLSGNSTGVFYEVNLSNKIVSNTITLSRLVKGDEQLTAVYQGFGLTDFYNVNAFLYTNAGRPADQDYATAVGDGGSLRELDSTDSSGEVKIENLTNDVQVNLGIFFTDKYKFATLISNPLSETPQNIEALLEKNACFLLTAGFNGDHPLIDYFRNFRDKVLARTALGKAFIKSYYSWGPKLAPVVLSHPWLAKSVRGSAQVMYWVIEYRIWLVMLVFAMGLALGTLMLLLNRSKGELSPWQVTVNGPISNTAKAPKMQNAERFFPNS